MFNNLDAAVDIKNITMKNYAGTSQIDIKKQVLRMDLFESILSPVLYAEMDIYDTSNILNKFPIIGEENISFSFKSNSGDERKINLRVFGVTNKTVSDDKSRAHYTLRLCSPELFKGSSNLLSKKYKKEISAIVKDLIGNISEKDIKIEQSKGIENAVLAQMKTMVAIDYLRRRAISPDYKSSSYCFFENKRGFNFRTLEGMFKDGKSSIGDKIWYLDNAGGNDIDAVSYRNIYAFHHPGISDNLGALAKGALNNSTTHYDITTGAIKTKIFQDPSFDSVDNNGRDLNSAAFKKDFMEDLSASYFMFTDSDLPETDLPDKISYIQSFANKLMQNVLQIWVAGDSTVTVGDVSKINIPNISDIDNDDKEDRLYSGNYLISKIRHMFQFSSGDDMYTMSMELIKGTTLLG